MSKKAAVKTIRISRRWWWRGELAADDSGLRMPNRKQCCLGFVCAAYGVKANAMVNVAFPASLSDSDRDRLPAWLKHEGNASDVMRTARINDDDSESDKDREQKIAAIFARHGLRAVFTR